VGHAVIVLGPHRDHTVEPHAQGYYCRDCDVVLPLPERGQTTASLSADLHDQDLAADISVKTEFGL